MERVKILSKINRYLDSEQLESIIKNPNLCKWNGILEAYNQLVDAKMQDAVLEVLKLLPNKISLEIWADTHCPEWRDS